MILSSKAYREYEKESLRILKQYQCEVITYPVEVKALFFMDTKRKVDLINLEESIADILERAGIIENDNLILSWDGSRIAGVDKNNPRVEIEIKRLEG
jgi:Holliday junction resolvase RusA-like endonuclease